MSVSVNFNGQTYSIPSNRQPRGWGTSLSAFLVSVGNNALSKAGGSFTLTADANFGASYGLVAPYLKSASATIAQSGVLRLANDEGIAWRDAGNSTDKVLKVNASDKLDFDGAEVALRTDKLNAFASTSSSELAGAISDETGTGSLVFGTSPTLVTPIIDDYLELNEENSIATPSAGKVRLGAKSNKRAYLKNSDGTEIEIGSAAGSGEINVISNPSAITDVTGYVASGAGITVARTTTSTDLPLAGVIESAIKITPVSDSDYVRYRFTMPEALKNKKLKIEFHQRPLSGYASGDIKLKIHTNSASDYSGTDATLALSTDSSGVTGIPNSSGKFTTTFDSNSSDYYELRFIRVAGTTALNLTNLIVGPGIQPQGAVVTDWQSYTPTITNLPTSITTARYRRVGSSVEIMANATASGAATGEIRISLPTGLTIDTSAIAAQDASTIFGHAEARNGGGSEYHDGNVIWAASTTAVRVIANAGSGYTWDATHPFTWANGDVLTINFAVPIAEWAGSGTLNVAQNDVEYVWNSSSTDAADTTSFGYGPQGTTGILGTTVLTTSRAKRVRFQSPIQQTDSIWIEIYDSSSSAWLPVYSNRHGTLAYSVQNNTDYGMYLAGVNSTDVDVSFARYSRSTNSTFGTAGADWNNAGLVGSKWRVVKAKAGSAVGFGAATATQRGLVAPRTVQTNLTVTCAQGGFNSIRAIGIAYQDQGGAWRLKFNLASSFTSATITAMTLSISGVTFKNTSNFYQAVNALFFVAPLAPKAYADPNSNNIIISSPSTASVAGISISGDVELDSKPTWAN